MHRSKLPLTDLCGLRQLGIDLGLKRFYALGLLQFKADFGVLGGEYLLDASALSIAEFEYLRWRVDRPLRAARSEALAYQGLPDYQRNTL